MIGAIAGDIIGSMYENSPTKRIDFKLFPKGACFTDDTVLTIAVAHALTNQVDYAKSFEDFYYKYPRIPYGARFHEWAGGHDHKPYNSWGNGSAMRVSATAYVYDELDLVLEEARLSAVVTHNHEEGIKGAQATACAIFLARLGFTKNEIRGQIETRFGYNLNRSLESIRPNYICDLSCQHTVPEAIICFLESDSFESTIRNAVSLGSDSDTIACIAGSIAEPFYKSIPPEIIYESISRLDDFLIQNLRDFYFKFKIPNNVFL